MVETDYGEMLREAGAKYVRATAAHRQADAERTYAIRAAHRHGGWTVRRIAAELGVSYQLIGRLVRRR
jgi:hypothetical protein